MTQSQACLAALFGLAMVTAALTLMFGWWALFGGGLAFFVFGLLFVDLDATEDGD